MTTAPVLRPLKLCVHPRRGDVHAAHGAKPIEGTVPVASATHEQSELLAEGRKPRQILAAVAWVPNFEAIESECRESFNAIPCALALRMRPDCDATTLVYERDSVGEIETKLADVGRLPVAQPAIECVSHVARPSTGDHGARHVRPSDGTAGGLYLHHLDRDRHAVLVQSRNDFDRAINTGSLHLDQSLSKHRRVAQVQPEQMNLPCTVNCAELDTVHQVDAKCVGSLLTRCESVKRIMISDRNGLQISGFGQRDQFRRSCAAVGRGGVRMQIDVRALLPRRRGHDR